MPAEESQFPVDWFRFGEKDLKRVEILLAADDLEAAGFYLQQAMEKSLKGFLLSKGWRLKRLHNLETLLNDAILYVPALEVFRPLCQKVTEYYIEERYPFIARSQLTVEEIRASMEEGKKFIERVREQAGR